MTQTERRITLIKKLLAEKPQYRKMPIPHDESEQRRLLRSLMNVRIPRQIGDDFLAVQDGCLMDEVVSMQGKRWKLSDVVKDPENKKIPSWDKVVAMVKENAPKLKHIARIGWDIAMSEDGEPVVIEYNLGSPGATLSQITGGPLFGAQTDAALEFLKDRKNQKEYIPHWRRCNGKRT